jgi:hypothetical protein
VQGGWSPEQSILVKTYWQSAVKAPAKVSPHGYEYSVKGTPSVSVESGILSGVLCN